MIEVENTTMDGSKVNLNRSIKAVITRCGVAKGAQRSCPFKMVIEKKRWLQPSQIRKLLEANKSLQEINTLLVDEDNPFFTYKGSIWLDDDETYTLLDTDVIVEDNGFTLTADVVADRSQRGFFPNKLLLGKSCNVVGKIRVRKISESMEGELTIGNGHCSDNYWLLFDSSTNDSDVASEYSIFYRSRDNWILLDSFEKGS